MKIVRLSDVVLWDKNPHIGDVDLLIKGFVDFGFNGAIRLWRDNLVMGGNHCVKALISMKEQGQKPPHGITLTKDGEWGVPFIDISHLSRTKAEAFALADNRTSELSDNDDQRLAGLLQQIAIDDESLLPAVGYTQDDIDKLLGLVGGSDDDSGDNDAGSDDGEPPDDFGSYDENVKTDHTCPKCGYKWSGGK